MLFWSAWLKRDHWGTHCAPSKGKRFLQDSHLLSFDGRVESEAMDRDFPDWVFVVLGSPLPLQNGEHLLGWALHVAESL